MQNMQKHAGVNGLMWDQNQKHGRTDKMLWSAVHSQLYGKNTTSSDLECFPAAKKSFNSWQVGQIQVAELNINLIFPSEISFKHPSLCAFNCTDSICQGHSFQ